MLTIKDIEAQVKATKDAREQMKNTQLENEEQGKKYRMEANAAAAAGDLARYKELKSLAEDAEDLAFVCKKQLEAEQPAPVTLDQTREAWEGYAADYNKKLAAKLRKFEAAKAEMLKEYAEAVALQGEACAVRERLAGYAGRSLQPSGVIDKRLADTYQMDYIPCVKSMGEGVKLSISGSSVADPDAAYYMASLQLDGQNLFNDPRQHTITAVVHNHRAAL